MNETVADLIDQDDVLSDQMNRPLRDLRISLTDKCNFRCPYCMPKEIFKGMEDRVFKLPMRNPVVKSLNLANVATAVAYQALRTQLEG